jgi:hypothetical protein
MVSPAVRVEGVSLVKGRGSQNPRRPLLARQCKSGPADACTFNTVVSVRGEVSKILFEISIHLEGGNGLYLH